MQDSSSWKKICAFTALFFLISFSDSLIAYWAPIHLQENFGSPVLMGLIMGFSSIVGLLADLLIPLWVRRVATVKLIFLAGVTSLTVSAFLAASLYAPYLLFFLFAMASWGIYYELLGFSEKQFVAQSVPHKLHTSAWAFIFTFRSLAYTIGPFVASRLLLAKSSITLLVVTVGLTIAGYFLMLVLGVWRSNYQEVERVKHLSLLSELEHWKVLFVHIWPIITLSMMMGLVDSAFWTTGAVLSEKISETSSLGSLILPAYMAPSLFVGFLVIKWRPQDNRERKGIYFYMVASVFLAMMVFFDKPLTLLGLILISSMLSSFTYPILDGVYADAIARMGRQRMHLMGLTSSAISLAYIVGPVIAGALSEWLGELGTFSVMGGMSFVVGLVLLFFLPKKILLPQSEIQRWK